MITPKKWQQLKRQMDAAGLFEDELDEKFIIGSGSGGQKLHKTASTVYIKHLPTGIEVKCQISRLRDDNRFYARRRLLEKFTEKILREKTERENEIAKIRRQKRRRSRKAKQKMLDGKRQRSETKNLRKPPKE
jgi:protein subunit release factor B